MRGQVLIAVLGTFLALGLGSQAAAQELPVGEFHVAPPSGPVGTAVTVSGDFDRDITGVRFRCVYFDTIDEGLDAAHTPAEPSPSFTFEYKIPAELGLRQRGGATRATLIGECEFLAMAGHQLATANVPFTVTKAAVDLPSTGLAFRSHDAAGALAAVVILAAGGVVLVLMGSWTSRGTARPAPPGGGASTS